MTVPASFRVALAGAALFLPAPAFAAAPPGGDPVALRARAVLARHCAACHDGPGKAKGGLGYLLDRDRLVAAGLVVPGKPSSSPLYQRVHDGEMPPPTWKKRTFRRADGDLLARWIAAGAPRWSAPAPGRLLGRAEVLRLVRSDLERLPARQRRFLRYLSLAHLAGQPAAVQQLHRRGLAKLVNSLSWHPRLTTPVAIDPHQFVLRIDLRDYRWTARQWDRLAANYPYRTSEPGPIEQALARLAGSEQVVLRGDWFAFTASRPPFYHDLLALPSTSRALERQLGVDAAEGRDNDTALRAGFNGSGVARSNRVLERHDALHGAYWQSFDFSDNKGRQNIFEYPLGPEPGPAGFRPSGGEIIFHLPNGLQGYLVVDGDGRRIDRAPGDIVSDPNRPDRIVETGLSCIGCHARGILPKDDQVRAHVQKNPRAFTADVRDSVLALYARPARLHKRIREDNDRFAAALKQLGISTDTAEPVLAVVLRYEEVVDLRRAADELGVPADRLAALVRGSAERARALGPLLAARGTVQRAVFEESFAGLLKDLGEGAGRDPKKVVAKGPFRGHRGAVRALAWGPNGRSFVSGGEDGEVRLWDVETGSSRLLGRHGDEVLAVAFSGDGKRLASGSADRVIQVWDVAGGRRLARLLGHTDAVRALAVSADGSVVCSAGADRSIRVWQAVPGRQLRAWTAHAGAVTALALSADGRHLLSGSVDRTARLWQVGNGQLLSRFDHPAEVRAVALDPAGSHFLTGAGDGVLRLWRRGGSEPLRRLARHDGAVLAVALPAGGRELFSVPARSEAHASHQAASVAPDGTALLARDGVIHVQAAGR